MTTRSLAAPILCLVTDRTSCLGRPLHEVVGLAVTAGVSMVQLREKDLTARELLILGRRLLEPARSAGALLVVNDRVDVALALEADGVHLGGGSLPAREVRRLVGRETLIGVSVHSLEEALRAEGEGADYLVLGTIFETRSHPGAKPAGAALVRQVVSAVAVPVIAIGGIQVENAPSVMAAGAAGVAVITALQSAENVSDAARALYRAIQGGRLGNSRKPIGTDRNSGEL